ncbi:hypothetical protein TNCV_1989331 [Trichonephila clavipes]|nr:hypothetical protein TNCV_1989331 [Trichonephila clavipes]
MSLFLIVYSLWWLLSSAIEPKLKHLITGENTQPIVTHKNFDEIAPHLLSREGNERSSNPPRSADLLR